MSEVLSFRQMSGTRRWAFRNAYGGFTLNVLKFAVSPFVYGKVNNQLYTFMICSIDVLGGRFILMSTRYLSLIQIPLGA